MPVTLKPPIRPPFCCIQTLQISTFFAGSSYHVTANQNVLFSFSAPLPVGFNMADRTAERSSSRSSNFAFEKRGPLKGNVDSESRAPERLRQRVVCKLRQFRLPRQFFVGNNLPANNAGRVCVRAYMSPKKTSFLGCNHGL